MNKMDHNEPDDAPYREAITLLSTAIGLYRDEILTLTLDEHHQVITHNRAMANAIPPNCPPFKGHALPPRLYDHNREGSWAQAVAAMADHPDLYHVTDLKIRISDNHVLALFCVLCTSSQQHIHILGIRQYYADLALEETIHNRIQQFKAGLIHNERFHYAPPLLTQEEEALVLQAKTIIHTSMSPPPHPSTFACLWP